MYLLSESLFQVALVVEQTMSRSENLLSAGSSLASQVHAAAVNGDKGALQKLITGKQSP
jgi:hypothetical protein